MKRLICSLFILLLAIFVLEDFSEFHAEFALAHQYSIEERIYTYNGNAGNVGPVHKHRAGDRLRVAIANPNAAIYSDTQKVERQIGHGKAAQALPPQRNDQHQFQHPIQQNNPSHPDRHIGQPPQQFSPPSAHQTLHPDGQIHTHEQQYQFHPTPHDHQQHHHEIPSNIEPQPSKLRAHQANEQLQSQSHKQAYKQQVALHHHKSVVAENIQQVMFDGTNQVKQFHYAHTQIEWFHESTNGGDMDEYFMQNYESAAHNIAEQELHRTQHQHHPINELQHAEQPAYLHSYHHHLMYSRSLNDNFDVDLGQQYYYSGQPSDSCDSINSPSMLVVPTGMGESTCRATSTATGSSGNVPNLSQYNNKPSQNSNIEAFPLAAHHHPYESSLMAAIRHYWREVSGLCLASALFLNWLFVVVKRRIIASGLTRTEQVAESVQQQSSTFNQAKTASKDTNSNSAHDSAFEENISPISLDDVDDTSQSSSLQREKSALSIRTALGNSPVMRQRSSTLRAEPITIPITPRSHNSLSASLSNSLSNTSEYTSRYSSDFESIQRLGRGGFGIVFEARNKIDDCHYAVKRICLPLEKEARDRVMREVRALAKLDHAGIVRYYNAWLETPPDDWLKQHDAKLGIIHSRDGMSFPSTDGIYERYDSVTRAEDRIGSKIVESGDGSLSSNNYLKKQTNNYRKLLKKNSSSPSLDIVFEGSGSIRLESKKLNSSKRSSMRRRVNNMDAHIGDSNNSDSEDRDFIQFESRGDHEVSLDNSEIACDVSHSSRLTEPFSDTDGSDHEKPHINGIGNKANWDEDGRKLALKQQRETRHRFNGPMMTEELHVEKAYLYIQMQLCRKDTLKDWLKTNCEIRDKTVIFDLFYQIVDAVEYVHSQDLIHRDLKPSNIFFSLDGTLKIGDFGLCRAKTSVGVGSSLDLQEYVAESEIERGFEAVHTEQVGTQLYMSPEQLNGLSYNQKVDIFAMGLILLELLVPFRTQMQRVNVLFKARNNLYSDDFKTSHPREYELVKGLLNRCPQKRPTAFEIKQHELLTSAQLSQPVMERIYHRRRTISSNSSTE